MWVTSSFGDTAEVSAVASAAARRPARATFRNRPAATTVPRTVTGGAGLWSDLHQPTCCQQLAVHRAKVDELERWLTDTQHRLSAGVAASPILLVTGPAGCGKSSCVRCLADKLRLPLVQWTTPDAGRRQRDRMFAADEVWQGAGDTVPPEGQLRQFADFLTRANRYGSVLPSGGEATRLVLVDDLPQALVYKKEEFYDILRRYSRGARSPCVFVLSEGGARSDLSALSVFPDSVRAELGMHQITFRPLTNKQLVTAMERVLSAETTKTGGVKQRPGRAALDELAAASCGDVRAAVNALQFLCGVGADRAGEVTVQRLPKKARLQQPQPQQVAAVGSRDTTLGLFRAVGKIIYAKRGVGWEEAPLPPHLSDRRRPPLLERSPEEVLEKAGVQPDTVIAHLHHNYADFCSRLEDAVTGAAYISDADLLTADWQSRPTMQAYGSSVAARGVMFCRHSAVSLGFRQFSQPRLSSVEQQRLKRLESVRQSLADWRLPADTLVTELLPFLHLRAPSYRHSVVTLTNYDIGFYKSIYQPPGYREKYSDDEEDAEDWLDIEEFDD